ncbi:hypothetical protein [Maribacter sp. 2307ULW6-5]|uniref:hypothetical protein n=1 Tax=Maribacter sp. 2307ULW6-5 TaxID=3386275 RepID=UPI0039BC91B5
MGSLNQSICNLCAHKVYCVLTKDKDNVSSCSEYMDIVAHNAPTFGKKTIKDKSKSRHSKRERVFF